jgi:putative addiction module component (TIGR02574 family)
MSSPAIQVSDAAMQLPTEERIALVDLLLKSLNTPTRKDIDQLWAAEAERRIQEVESGEVELLDGEKVFSELRNKLKNG